MSERNTGLFLPGHVPADAVVRALLSIPGVSAADFQGDEAPRVGHGERQGAAYTHVALRLFEVGGFTLFDAASLPGPEDFEMALGTALSRAHGKALYLMFEDEKAVGGHALFEGGRLVSRQAVDGVASRPVVRDMNGERQLAQMDASDWVWAPMGDAVAAGSAALFGPGVRTDDDIEQLIQAADAKPALVRAGGTAAPSATAPSKAPGAAPSASTASPAPKPAPAPSPDRAAPPPREESGGGGLLSRLARKIASKTRGR